jgi:hypothetical protein
VKKPVFNNMTQDDQYDRDEPGGVPEKIPDLENPHTCCLPYENKE